VNIKVITTSEIKGCILIDSIHMEVAVKALHDACELAKARPSGQRQTQMFQPLVHHLLVRRACKVKQLLPCRHQICHPLVNLFDLLQNDGASFLSRDLISEQAVQQFGHLA
jgi:hypothetical protein